ncbi:MAG: hypothetical protein ACXADD_02035 [Candidatus Thorarchaeota archaeon]
MRVSTKLMLILFSVLLLQPVAIAQPAPYVTQFSISQSFDPIDTVSRDWNIEIVLVNYDPALIEEDTLTAGLPEWSNHTTSIVDISYRVDYSVSHAGATWTNDLTQFMLANSINGSDTGSQLNEAALEYQETHLDDPQTIFSPRAGRVIDGEAVEDWLNENPAVTPPSLGYILYVFNFSEFDSADHSLEHWYDYKPVDPDSGEAQNWFRLEWDNALNPDVKMQYAGFGGKHNLFVLDTSANQWYLRWARIWWGDSPYDDHPEHCTMDLEDKASSVDLGTPTGIHDFNVYLHNYLYDPVAYLFIPQQHNPSTYADSGRLKGLVFCMNVAAGVSVESLTWVTDANRQQHHLQELLPFIPWEVDIEFLDIDNYPGWRTLFWDNAYVDFDGTTVADGYAMFYDIRDNMRPNYFDAESEDIEVFGVVFIKQQMEMHAAGRTFTGLGGGGQTVIWKSWERYYRPDGVTPKDGVSSVQLHETMHAVGIGHTWSYGHYVGDFSYSPMGYFGFHNGTATFDQNWVQSTYLDQMEAELWNEFVTQSEDVGDDESPKTYEAQEKAMESFVAARQYYNMMMWQQCYDELTKARDFTTNMLYSQHDSTLPVIQEWGAAPWPIEESGFSVWVKVTDDLSGVQTVNVSLDFNGVNYGSYLCTQNGNNWTAAIPSFEITEDTLVEAYAVASDWGMNSATMLLFSEDLTFSLPVPEFPLEIIIGITAMAIVIAAGLFVFKRQTQQTT